jgi:hypothetical protein
MSQPSKAAASIASDPTTIWQSLKVPVCRAHKRRTDRDSQPVTLGIE